MASFLADNDDLRYYLERGIDWETLVGLGERGFRQPDGWKTADEAVSFFREAAAMVGELAAEEIAPHAAEIDRQGVRFADGEAVFPPRLAAIAAKIAELGLHGLPLPRELGGMNAPLLLYFI